METAVPVSVARAHAPGCQPATFRRCATANERIHASLRKAQRTSALVLAAAPQWPSAGGPGGSGGAAGPSQGSLAPPPPRPALIPPPTPPPSHSPALDDWGDGLGLPARVYRWRRRRGPNDEQQRVAEQQPKQQHAQHQREQQRDRKEQRGYQQQAQQGSGDAPRLQPAEAAGHLRGAAAQGSQPPQARPAAPGQLPPPPLPSSANPEPPPNHSHGTPQQPPQTRSGAALEPPPLPRSAYAVAPPSPLQDTPQLSPKEAPRPVAQPRSGAALEPPPPPSPPAPAPTPSAGASGGAPPAASVAPGPLPSHASAGVGSAHHVLTHTQRGPAASTGPTEAGSSMARGGGVERGAAADAVTAAATAPSGPRSAAAAAMAVRGPETPKSSAAATAEAPVTVASTLAPITAAASASALAAATAMAAAPPGERASAAAPGSAGGAHDNSQSAASALPADVTITVAPADTTTAATTVPSGPYTQPAKRETPAQQTRRKGPRAVAASLRTSTRAPTAIPSPLTTPAQPAAPTTRPDGPPRGAALTAALTRCTSLPELLRTASAATTVRQLNAVQLCALLTTAERIQSAPPGRPPPPPQAHGRAGSTDQDSGDSGYGAPAAAPRRYLAAADAAALAAVVAAHGEVLADAAPPAMAATVAAAARLGLPLTERDLAAALEAIWLWDPADPAANAADRPRRRQRRQAHAASAGATAATEGDGTDQDGDDEHGDGGGGGGGSMGPSELCMLLYGVSVLCPAYLQRHAPGFVEALASWEEWQRGRGRGRGRQGWRQGQGEAEGRRGGGGGGLTCPQLVGVVVALSKAGARLDDEGAEFLALALSRRLPFMTLQQLGTLLSASRTPAGLPLHAQLAAADPHVHAPAAVPAAAPGGPSAGAPAAGAPGGAAGRPAGVAGLHWRLLDMTMHRLEQLRGPGAPRGPGKAAKRKEQQQQQPQQQQTAQALGDGQGQEEGRGVYVPKPRADPGPYPFPTPSPPDVSRALTAALAACARPGGEDLVRPDGAAAANRLMRLVRHLTKTGAAFVAPRDVAEGFRALLPLAPHSGRIRAWNEGLGALRGRWMALLGEEQQRRNRQRQDGSREDEGALGAAAGARADPDGRAFATTLHTVMRLECMLRAEEAAAVRRHVAATAPALGLVGCCSVLAALAAGTAAAGDVAYSSGGHHSAAGHQGQGAGLESARKLSGTPPLPAAESVRGLALQVLLRAGELMEGAGGARGGAHGADVGHLAGLLQSAARLRMGAWLPPSWWAALGAALRTLLPGAPPLSPTPSAGGALHHGRRPRPPTALEAVGLLHSLAVLAVEAPAAGPGARASRAARWRAAGGAQAIPAATAGGTGPPAPVPVSVAVAMAVYRELLTALLAVACGGQLRAPGAGGAAAGAPASRGPAAPGPDGRKQKLKSHEAASQHTRSQQQHPQRQHAAALGPIAVYNLAWAVWRLRLTAPDQVRLWAPLLAAAAPAALHALTPRKQVLMLRSLAGLYGPLRAAWTAGAGAGAAEGQAGLPPRLRRGCALPPPLAAAWLSAFRRGMERAAGGATLAYGAAAMAAARLPPPDAEWAAALRSRLLRRVGELGPREVAAAAAGLRLGPGAGPAAQPDPHMARALLTVLGRWQRRNRLKQEREQQQQQEQGHEGTAGHGAGARRAGNANSARAAHGVRRAPNAGLEAEALVARRVGAALRRAAGLGPVRRDGRAPGASSSSSSGGGVRAEGMEATAAGQAAGSGSGVVLLRRPVPGFRLRVGV